MSEPKCCMFCPNLTDTYRCKLIKRSPLLLGQYVGVYEDCPMKKEKKNEQNS